MTRFVIAADEREYRARIGRLAVLANEDVEGGSRRAENGAWIIGTPEQVLERIAAYRGAGVERFMLQHLDYTDLDSLELFAARCSPPPPPERAICRPRAMFGRPGAIAQLGERLAGSQKVRGSIPLGSIDEMPA